MFYRKNPDKGGFVIFAGLESIVEYIKNLHFFDDRDEVYPVSHLLEWNRERSEPELYGRQY